MKFRRLLLGLIPLVFLGAACAATPELRNPKMLNDSSFVTGQPCKAPCWRGITPGETAWDEAVKIIQGDPSLANVQIQDITDGSAPAGSKNAVWSQKDGDPCCQMDTVDGKVVRALTLQVAPNVGLGELLKTQGNPKYVVGGGGDSNQGLMFLIYPDVPMVVFVFVAGTDSGALSASSEIIGVGYLNPGDMDLLLKTNTLQGWQGYQSYHTYVESTPEVTPSITLTPTPGS
jgi:hypothetical protein